MSSVESGTIQRWSTAAVPQSRRLDYFASAVSEAVFPLGVDSADHTTFNAEMSFAQLGAIEVFKNAGSAHLAFRGKRELARTTEHAFKFLMLKQSHWTADHGASLQMAPRDILVIDSRYPLKVSIPNGFSAITIGASECWVRQWLPNPKLLAARRIPSNSLWGHSLSSYLNELTPELTAAPPLPLSIISDQVGALLALTVKALQDSAFDNTPTLRSLHDRILDCIMQRCTEPQLTALDVAASINISVRTLHRSFAAADETFGDKLIEARARVAFRMLTSRLFNRVTTAEIGRRAGFLSASHFARVMRGRTGHTPRQLRRAVMADGFERSTSHFDAEAEG